MDALAQFLLDWGYAGLFVAAAVAGSIFPCSSEVLFVALLQAGLSPVGCLVSAAAGNTLGGMTCYWLGMLGRSEWIAWLGISEQRIARARRFVAHRGALMGFFAFLPVLGEAIALVLGLMRSNRWLTCGAMLAGKTLRYAVLWAVWKGILNW